MTLTWDDPGDDSITGYVILRRDSAIHEEGTFETVESDTGSAETTYTDDSAQPERKYVYRIKAINKHGLSAISSWVRAYTPAAPVPAAPTGLSATASHDSITLTWDDPGDDSITGYVILRRNRDIDAEGEFTTLVEDTGAAATTYTDDTRGVGYSLHLPDQGHQRARGERAFPLVPHPDPGGPVAGIEDCDRRGSHLHKRRQQVARRVGADRQRSGPVEGNEKSPHIWTNG